MKICYNMRSWHVCLHFLFLVCFVFFWVFFGIYFYFFGMFWYVFVFICYVVSLIFHTVICFQIFPIYFPMLYVGLMNYMQDYCIICRNYCIICWIIVFYVGLLHYI